MFIPSMVIESYMEYLSQILFKAEVFQAMSYLAKGNIDPNGFPIGFVMIF
jgi:hypothetical protein